MNITEIYQPNWLLVVFTLPSTKASERVQIWRKLQKIGAVPFRNAGYLLPDTPDNRERFEWLATTIRGFDGEASILQIQSIDDMPLAKLKDLFREARAAEYAALLQEIQQQAAKLSSKNTHTARLRRKLEEIVKIDFFESPAHTAVEQALADLENSGPKVDDTASTKALKSDYLNRVWVTRPRPGIDRVSSAWLISRFIDPQATFAFDTKAPAEPDVHPFDMYGDAGFGHRGELCTFETLCQAFQITDSRVAFIAQAVHDADLEDDKFGRTEGHTMNQILKGWAIGNIPDADLLQRGIDLVEGLYTSLPIEEQSA